VACAVRPPGACRRARPRDYLHCLRTNLEPVE
jgi:hypothetical protein